MIRAQNPGCFFQSDVQTKDGLIAHLKAQMGRLQAELTSEKGKGANFAAEIGKLSAAAGAGAAVTKSLETDKAKRCRSGSHPQGAHHR